jgi:amicyanin
MHHIRIALACATLAVGVAACSTPAKAPPPPVDFGTTGDTPVAPAPPVAGTAVSIVNFAFSPADLSVKVGDTVTWTNKDEEPHNVVAGDGSFRSPGLDSNGTYSYTFTKVGSFDYMCGIHPFMHGTVVVKP